MKRSRTNQAHLQAHHPHLGPANLRRHRLHLNQVNRSRNNQAQLPPLPLRPKTKNLTKRSFPASDVGSRPDKGG